MRKKQKTYLFGIDAGYNHCGITVFDPVKQKFVYSECIEPPHTKRETKAREAFEKCQYVSNSLLSIAERYKPSSIYVELPTGGSKSQNAIRGMAAASAIIASFSAIEAVKCKIVTPTMIKRLVKPKGAVEKEEVQDFVELVLEPYGFYYPNKKLGIREHIADAAAALVAGGAINFSVKNVAS